MVYEMQLCLLFIDRPSVAITDKYPSMKQWVRGKIWGNLGRGILRVQKGGVTAAVSLDSEA
jgi:hypothetical protein